ncbi:MAG: coniferyl aldehyde dehydrogenase [Betaproteobacteria bacterium]|nr:coniferyl aldehyde dehydrogenase [Betaproteobacteria bacterium]
MTPPVSQPLDTDFARHREAFVRSPFPAAGDRIDLLGRLEALVKENAGAWADAISRDFGNRSRHETQLLELFPSLEGIRHARRHLRRWMRPERRSTSLWFLPGSSRIVPQPLGVVGIVVPWNYPLYLAVGPLVAALAAGNRAMVKMSETTPATGALLADLAARYFEGGEISVVNGGPDVAQAFCRLPFDHLLFTGSTGIGRHVMRSAAENLTPVTLELGGKSPAIVGRGFPVGEAAGRVMYGKCLNAGQTCVAPDYVLVPRESEQAFVESARLAVAALYPTLARNDDYTSIVDERHRQRLASLLVDAERKGARATEINPAGEDLAAAGKRAPTLLTGVDDSMDVMREEIFGPLLPVIPYDRLEDAIAFVNARPRPLALYVFENDRGAVDQVIRNTVSGGVTVNETILHIAQDDLPFGGVGASGMGHYHGREGFDTFSKRKPVFRQSGVNGLKLFRAPYGGRFDRLVRLLLR